MSTLTFTVSGMHCASCGILIDETLEDDVAGVQRSETSLRTGRTTVHAGDSVTPQAIADAIAGAGYSAVLEGTS
ncbi:MAG TPA: heavy metal transporter [Micromonosporaceae bacterium]|nr:heavy metal transporter [Micromonosporaceae bacterium]